MSAGWKRLKARALGAFKPLVAVAVAAGSVGVLAAVASQDDDVHPARWSQGIALLVLFWTTVLLYWTLPTRRTVLEEFKVGEQAKTVGETLPEAVYADLGPEDRKKVSANRGFRALYAGLDGRWSTSKVQVLLWTYAIIYGLLALFLFAEFGGTCEPGHGVCAADATFDFSKLGLDDFDTYLILLGGPFAAAVLAKGITSSKVAGGDIAKPDASPTDEDGSTPGVVAGVRDVISSDGGGTDLIDFQYFLFNLLALGFFFVTLVPTLEAGLPKLPDLLVALTGASALAYVTKKGVERKKPQITRVEPASAFPGQMVKIYGLYLAPSGREPGVKVGRKQGKIMVVRGGGTDQAMIEACLPADAETGKDRQLVVEVEGAAAPATHTIDVAAVEITAVEPAPIPRVADTPVVVKGAGFGASGLKLVLGGNELSVVSWSEARIAAKLTNSLPVEGARLLEVFRHDYSDDAEHKNRRGDFRVEVAPP